MTAGADTRAGAEPMLEVEGLNGWYGAARILFDLSLQVGRGEVVALMGRNGAGKSTLLRAIAGSRGPFTGTVTVTGLDPRQLKPRDLITRVGLVPSDPSALLYEQTVQAECEVADKEHGLEPGATRSTLESIQPGIDPTHHPRDISEGERLALALAVVLAPGPRLVLLDEPTRGLDYSAKARLSEILRALAGSSEGRSHAIVLATHDVELVASAADRGVVLADGEVVSDGPAREVVVHSPVFAPQVAKILAPAEWLTVAEVSAALAS